MRVSCGCPLDTASSTLIERLQILGVDPIVTNTTIRALYEGPDKSLGEAIVEMYSHEADHDITVFYDKAEQAKSARRAERKAERAARNAKLHGHR